MIKLAIKSIIASEKRLLQVKLTDLMLGYVSSAIQQRVEIIYFHDAWLALITSRTEYIFLHFTVS